MRCSILVGKIELHSLMWKVRILHQIPLVDRAGISIWNIIIAFVVPLQDTYKKSLLLNSKVAIMVKLENQKVIPKLAGYESCSAWCWSLRSSDSTLICSARVFVCWNCKTSEMSKIPVHYIIIVNVKIRSFYLDKPWERADWTSLIEDNVFSNFANVSKVEAPEGTSIDRELYPYTVKWATLCLICAIPLCTFLNVSVEWGEVEERLTTSRSW